MNLRSVGLDAYGRSDVGRVRDNNEDALVIADLMLSLPIHAMERSVDIEVGPRGVLLAVSDGMGGAQAGEVASALTLHSLRRAMSTLEANSAESALTASVERANRKVWDTAMESGRQGMGATLTAVLVHGTRAYVAEVGDSRAYLIRGDRIFQVTRDQSYAQLMVDTGAITREEADTFEYKNVILQAIGTKPSVVVALNRFTLCQHDRMLLCSDGLSGKVTDAEIHTLACAPRPLEDACGRLIALANSRGGEDNITVLVARMRGEGLPTASPDGSVSLETVRAFDP
jgi:serine/threonine protein phosphatase PrpC